jgi:hypothetical protein
MKYFLFTLSFSLLSSPVWAAGSLNYLDVNQGVVYFSTEQAKIATSPTCVDAAQAEKWALSLESDNGRAMYSMLMTAMATRMKIGVETASDCNAVTGFERPLRVWFDASGVPSETSAVETVTAYKPVAYGKREYSSNYYCRVYSTLKNPSNLNYMYANNSSYQDCECRIGSKRVQVAGDKNTYEKYYQCVIEVEVPIFSSSN